MEVFKKASGLTINFELNRLLYKRLWNGTDKVTKLSTINEFEKGGLRMIDLECMIRSLRLAWLKRIFSKN